MRRAFIHFQRTNLRFRRWSRAKYAAFVSIHRQVTMGQLVSSLADRFYAKQALLHGGMMSSPDFGGNTLRGRGRGRPLVCTLAYG